MSEAEKAPEPETGSTNSPEVSQPAEASSDPAKASTPTEDSNPVSESGGDGPVTKETAKSSEDKDAGEETSNETEEEDNKDPSPTEAPALPSPIVSSSKKSRPPYKYDPDKITLRFLFANRDGLTVTVESKPVDTVGEVKAALLSVWPEGKKNVESSTISTQIFEESFRSHEERSLTKFEITEHEIMNT